MKKLLLPIIITSCLFSSVSSAQTEEDIKNIINKNEKQLFANQSDKGWGDTPTFIKLLTVRINVKNKSEGLSPFNVIWLKKVYSSPKTYGLSVDDQKWIKSQIDNAKKNNSIFWLPSGLEEKLSQVKSNEKPTEQSVEKSSNKPVEQVVEKSNDNPVEKPVEKTVDKPTEQPVEKPAYKPVEQPVEKTSAKPVEQSAEKSVDNPVEKSINKPLEQSTEKEVNKPIEINTSSLPVKKATLIKDKKLRNEMISSFKDNPLPIIKENNINQKNNNLDNKDLQLSNTNISFYMLAFKLFLLSLISTLYLTFIIKKNKKLEIK